jgi:predicted ribosomally synthesized peptide with nif11-like leader
MFIHDAIEFLVRISDDPGLFEAVAPLGGEAMVHRAREMGLSFTSAELVAAVASPDMDPACADSELSDDDLEEVSGGLGLDVSGLAASVLRQSDLQNVVDLGGYADKVRRSNSTKRRIRDRMGQTP